MTDLEIIALVYALVGAGIFPATAHVGWTGRVLYFVCFPLHMCVISWFLHYLPLFAAIVKVYWGRVVVIVFFLWLFGYLEDVSDYADLAYQGGKAGAVGFACWIVVWSLARFSGTVTKAYKDRPKPEAAPQPLPPAPPSPPPPTKEERLQWAKDDLRRENEIIESLQVSPEQKRALMNQAEREYLTKVARILK